MKIFKNTIALLALSAALLLSACTNQKVIPTDPPTAPSVDVYGAYKSVLTDIPSDNPLSCYALFDLNGDNILELITNDGSWNYEVYTIKDNDLFHAGTVPGKYGLYTYQGTALTAEGGTGYLEYVQFSLDSNYCAVRESVPFLVHESMVPVSPDMKYQHNGELISEKEYAQYESEMYQIRTYLINNYIGLELVK